MFVCFFWLSNICKRFLGKSYSVTRLSVISNAADVMCLMDLTKANSTNNQDGKYVLYYVM